MNSFEQDERLEAQASILQSAKTRTTRYTLGHVQTTYLVRHIFRIVRLTV